MKLAKLLMASDFGAYERFGATITGATYEKWEQGHFPRELTLADRDLEAQGAISVEDEDYFGKTLRRVTARRDPEMSEFTEDELAVIEMAILRFGHETASRLATFHIGKSDGVSQIGRRPSLTRLSFSGPVAFRSQL